jgi:hypothetical protein
MNDEDQSAHWETTQTKLVWATWAFVLSVVVGLMLGLAYVIGKIL